MFHLSHLCRSPPHGLSHSSLGTASAQSDPFPRNPVLAHPQRPGKPTGPKTHTHYPYSHTSESSAVKRHSVSIMRGKAKGVFSAQL